MRNTSTIKAMLFVLLFAFTASVQAQIYNPEGLNIPGTWNTWTNPPSNKLVVASATQVASGKVAVITTGTRRYQTTFKAANTGGDVTSGTHQFKFTSGPSASAWNNQWGGVTVTMNTLQSYSYGTPSLNTPGNCSITLTDNKYYTVNWEDKGYVATRAIFMQTTAAPVNLTAATQSPASVSASQAVTVTITSSAALSAEEKVYVRYTNNNWTTSSLAAATFTGTTGTATIPGQAAGTTVQYYVMSTTLTNPTADFDLVTLRFKNNAGTNYSYTVSSTPTPSIALTFDGSITERAENGEVITVTLSNDQFKATLNTANWTVTNLPAGVTKGTLTRVSNTVATITLSGNSTSDYDANVTNMTVTVAGAELVTNTTVNPSKNTGVTFTAIVEATPSITIASDGNITEGTENGEIITVTLTNDQFKATLNTANWTLTNLPAGVTKGTLTRVSATQATIALSGNRTTDYDVNITNMTLSISNAELVNNGTATGTVSKNTGVIFTAIVEPTPAIALTYDGNITEGAENGEVITITLSNDQFKTTLTTANWTVTNLPAGVSKGTLTRVSNTVATIVLSGNRTTDYDVNITNLTISVAAAELVSATGVSANSGVTFTAILEPNQSNVYKKVVLQSFWWDYWNSNYPNDWADYLAAMAPRLKTIGIDAVWVPPSYKNNHPSYVGYAPFDHYDLGDKFQKNYTYTRVGTKDQLLRMVAIFHANGIESIQDIVLNHVTDGGSGTGAGGQDPEPTYSMATSGGYKNFRYVCYESPATDETATNYLNRKGRWSKNYQNFHPQSGHNATGDDWTASYWGPDFCYDCLQNGSGHGQSTNATYNPTQTAGYTRTQAREWIKWFVKQTDMDGFRWDATKHFPYFVQQDLVYNAKYANDWASRGETMFCVGEWVEFNGNNLNNYVNQVTTANGGTDYLMGAFDFSLRDAVKSMVLGMGGYDMSFIAGAQQSSRFVVYPSGKKVHRTVPFVNSHDTFRPILNSTTGNYSKALGDGTGWDNNNEIGGHIDPREPRLSAAYAVIFSMDGNPVVFIEDLFDVGTTGKRFTHQPTNTTDLPVRDDIANIIWCHQNLNFKDGDYKVRWQAPDIFIAERSKKALVCVTDNYNSWQNVTGVQTDFTDGTILVDYSGANGTTEKTVYGGGKVDISIPPCSGVGVTNGRKGYSIWAPKGVASWYVPQRSAVTTQEWEMANDLGDSHPSSLGQGGQLPANSTAQRVAGKIFVAQGTAVNYAVHGADTTKALVVGLYDLNGVKLAEATGTKNWVSGVYTAAANGWITIKVNHAVATSPTMKCWVKTSYTAPSSITAAKSTANATLYELSSKNQAAIWTGNKNNDATDNYNWEQGIMPQADVDVVVNKYTTDLTLKGDVAFKNLRIEEGRTVTFAAASNIVCKESVILQNGALNFAQTGATISVKAANDAVGTITLKAGDVNNLCKFETASAIPVEFIANRDGNFTFNLALAQNTKIQSAYIEDRTTGTFTDLRNGSYAFAATEGTYADRFVLHLTQQTTNVNVAETSMLQTYAYNNQVYIVGAKKGAAIEVYNIAGELITNTRSNTNITKIAVNGVAGYYLVKVNENKQSVTNKVFVR